MGLVQIFFIWKILSIVTSILAPKFIPYLGFFSYGPTMHIYGMPDFIRALTNFDGIFYIRIALNGYSLTEQAYFPLYPLTIRFVNYFVNNPIIAGVLITNIAFILGLYILNKYLNLISLFKESRFWIMVFLLFYPTAYYFGVMYTESLFFLLFITTLYFIKIKQYPFAFLFAFLTSLTRVVGFFVIIPIGISLLGLMVNSKRWQLRETWVKYWKLILVLIAPILGLSSYCYYLYLTTRDPIYFVHAQESFGANRSSHLITPFQVVYRYLKILLTADRNFQYYIALVELIFYLFAVSLLSYDLYKLLKHKKLNFDRLGLNLFSFVNLIVPSLTGTLTAMPRYTLLSFSIFFVLAEIQNKILRIILATLFFIFQIIFFAFFVQGYYIT